MNKRLLSIVTILFGVLFLSSCSAAEGSIGASAVDMSENQEIKEFYVDAYNWDFSESGEEIKVGDTVRLIVTSSEGAHGIAIPGLGIVTGAVAPGGEEVVEFVATEAGEFDYYCNVACGTGHANMRKTITISE